MLSEAYQKLEKKVWANRPQGPQTLAERRAVMEKTGKVFRLADDITCEQVDVGGVPGEWIIAPGAASHTVVLYFHGGGYVMGSIDTHRDMISRISRASGARVLAVNYRLAPEHPFPAAVDDGVTAYRWLLSQGLDPGCTAIAGDSAGGGLTMATLVALHDAGDPLPATAVCISPWVDLTNSGNSVQTKAAVDPMVSQESLQDFAMNYLGNTDPTTPLASPLFADLEGLPPLLIQVGTAEILLDDATRLAARAEAAGLEVTLEQGAGLMHVWHWFAPMAPEGAQAIERLGAYVHKKFNRTL